MGPTVCSDASDGSAHLVANTKGGWVTGVDVDGEQLAEARAWSDEARLTIVGFVRADATRTPLSRDSYDLRCQSAARRPRNGNCTRVRHACRTDAAECNENTIRYRCHDADCIPRFRAN
jgi:hypothetical protein